MQGGIRRKQDLLPRYNTPATRRAMLTTPLKKLLAYAVLLTLVYVAVRTGLSGGSEPPAVELEAPRAPAAADRAPGVEERVAEGRKADVAAM
ncbi:AaceriABR090Wp [[Ashbya] aceris (nom. inval.)]|nr:AaceriABR090Wp [[Ashbya] aceris (nom. inval.)]